MVGMSGRKPRDTSLLPESSILFPSLDYNSRYLPGRDQVDIRSMKGTLPNHVSPELASHPPPLLKQEARRSHPSAPRAPRPQNTPPILLPTPQRPSKTPN